MKRVVALVFGAVLATAAVASAQAPAAGKAVPTFSKDIAPIFYKNCVLCHRPGEVAPMSLIKYDEARPWAKAIKRKVVAKEMPPWFAEPGNRKLKNDRTLEQKDIDTIAAWVDGGAPQGDPEDMPEVPQFAGGWVFGQPDWVVQMAYLKDLPAEGEIENEVTYTPFNFTEEKFIQAAQMLPTTMGVVHHANMGSVTMPRDTKLVKGKPFGPDGKPLSSKMIKSVEAPTLVADDASKIVCYVPGRGWERWPEGVGKRLTTDSYARFNMHYQATGKPEKDQTQLGVWFAKPGTVNHELFNSSMEDTFIVEGKEIAPESEELIDAGGSRLPKIPAYVDNWKLVSVAGVREPMTIYGFSPHMHLRGHDMKYIITYPDGKEETLLSVPKYDFNWQLYYELDTPAKIPAGSKVTVVSHFDNSLKNPYNPAPHLEVNWSEQSWDEMYSPQMRFSVDSWQLNKAPAKAQQQH